jgi:cyclic pyranopterin phosphate synthase
MSLSHIDESGRARMVDVSAKDVTLRTARAEGRLRCAPQTLDHVRAGTAPKGAVLATAEIAGIMAAKRTSELIPLCHPLPIEKVAVAILEEPSGFQVTAEVRTTGRTGVEMEALTAVSVACLTLFDMLKAIDKSMTIDGVAVVSKTGGRSGEWSRPDDAA